MHEVVNPFDLTPIGSVPTHDWAAVDGALERAHRLARDRTQWKKPHQRAAILHRAMGIMKERRDHLAFQIANEGGKPLIDARVEVDRAINGMELCIHEIGSLRGTEIPMGLTAAGDGEHLVGGQVRRFEPRGWLGEGAIAQNCGKVRSGIFDGDQLE